MRKLNFKVIQVFLVIALFFSFCSTRETQKSYAEPKTRIVELMIDETVTIINGEPQIPLELPVFLKNGRTMVPIRFFAEAFDIRIDLEWEKKLFKFKANDSLVEMQINNTTVKVNGKDVQIDTPAIIVSGRSVIPIRFIMETFGATVTWDSILHKVTIVYEIPEEEG